MKSMVSRSVVWASLSLFLIAAAISVGQSVGTMIGKAEAQALIQTFQGHVATDASSVIDKVRPLLKPTHILSRVATSQSTRKYLTVAAPPQFETQTD